MERLIIKTPAGKFELPAIGEIEEEMILWEHCGHQNLRMISKAWWDTQRGTDGKIAAYEFRKIWTVEACTARESVMVTFKNGREALRVYDRWWENYLTEGTALWPAPTGDGPQFVGAVKNA